MAQWPDISNARRCFATAGWFALTLAAGGCAWQTEREVIGPETDLGVQLGFIRAPDARRELVQARLGDPSATFEGGRIVGYAVYADRGRLSLHGGQACYGLMIEYEGDGRVANAVLIRHGSAQCRKD